MKLINIKHFLLVFSLLITIAENMVPHYNKILVSAGIDVFSIVPKNSLEEYFLSLTEKDSNVHNH